MTLSELKNNIQNDWVNLTGYSQSGSNNVVENDYLEHISSLETDVEKFTDKCDNNEGFYVFKANIYSVDYQSLQSCLNRLVDNYSVYPNLVGYDWPKIRPVIATRDAGESATTMPLTYIDDTTPGNGDLFFGSIIITYWVQGQE